MGERKPNPTPGPTAQSFSFRNIFPQLLAAKTSMDVLVEEMLEPQAVPLEEHIYGLSYSNSLPLNSTTSVVILKCTKWHIGRN